MSIEWRIDEVMAAVEKVVSRGLDKAGRNTASAIRSDLSTPGPDPSPPGEPPHMQSGQLHDAVDHTEPVRVSDGQMTRVGVLDQDQWPKAVRLARGYTGTDKAGRTYDQKPRPYLGAVRRRAREIVREVANG